MSFRILSAELSHETNTFNIRPTTLAAFQGRFLLHGNAAIAARGDQNTELAGLLDTGRDYGWQISHVISAGAGPGGVVTRAAFDAITAPLMEAAAQGPWDGIFLMLHGAMVTEFCEDGEGELMARLRAIVGRDLPVAVTLDPHANVTVAMCDLAQILVSYTTYPHVDSRATGRRTAELLQRMLTGAITPVTLRAHVPILEEANGGRTDAGPMVARHALARAFEAREGVYAISINGAFASADIAEVGPTVLITCDADTPAHRAIAQGLADDIWAKRADVLNTYLTSAQAADIARAWDGAAGPLVIADYADNPGAGAYADATALLAALLEAGVRDACFGPLVDPASAAVLAGHSLGDAVTLDIGGATSPDYGGGPLRVIGVLKWAGSGLVTGTGPIMGGLTRDFGQTAVLEVAGIDILIVSLPHQMLDLAQFTTFGIDPEIKSVVALKSMQHFRAAFGPVAGRVIVCDSGALCTLDYASLAYENVPRPTYPLE